MEDKHESDSGLVCRLAHEFLGEGSLSRNAVLNKLPMEFRGNVEDLAKNIKTDLDTTPTWKNTNSGQAFIWQKINAFQWQKCFHQPISRMERLQSNGVDNWQAKRFVCELLQAWVVANKEKEEENVDEDEVKAYASFVVSVLHYYDRWQGKYLGSDSFCQTLVAVLRKLQDMKCSASSSERQYCKVLERLFEKSSELLDHALRVVLLSMADNHLELEAHMAKNGNLTVKQLTNRKLRSGSAFWASDFGMIVDSALVRSDPTRFKAAGCWGLTPQTTDAATVSPGAAGSAASWSMWTHEGGNYKVYEFNSVNEANQAFSQINACAILVGPTGKIKDKAWTSNAVLSKVMQNDMTMQKLHWRVDLHLNLHRCAVGLQPNPASKEAEVLVPAAPQVTTTSVGGSPRNAPSAAVLPPTPSREAPTTMPPPQESTSATPAPAAAAAAPAAAPVQSGAWFRRSMASIAMNFDGALGKVEQSNAGKSFLATLNRAATRVESMSTGPTASGVSTIPGSQEPAGESAAAAAAAVDEKPRRPTKGDRVKIIQENEEGGLDSPDRQGTLDQVGMIIEDDESNQPYNVDFGDGIARWYKENWVELIMDPEADDEPSSGDEKKETTEEKDQQQQQQPEQQAKEATSAAVASSSSAKPPDDGVIEEVVRDEPVPSAVPVHSPRQSPRLVPPHRGPDSEADSTDIPSPSGAGTDCGDGDIMEPKASSDDVMDWNRQCQSIYDRWMNGRPEGTGLAENFRGGRRVKWQEGAVSKATTMPALILDLPKKFSELLECHVQVMGAVNQMVSRGGSKEGLAAIYALRQRSSITGQLGSAMDSFIATAQLCHGVLQHELFKCVEVNKRIPGQTPQLQRMYLQSFNACPKLRDAILTEWHNLALKVNDATLADEFRRCDAVARESYNQLMRVPVIRTALADVPAGYAGVSMPLALPPPTASLATVPGAAEAKAP